MIVFTVIGYFCALCAMFARGFSHTSKSKPEPQHEHRQPYPDQQSNPLKESK